MASTSRETALSALNKLKCVVCKIAQKLKSVRQPAAPKWYTAEEIRHYLLCASYSTEVANELSVQYAANLQRAFNKGFELGKRAAKP